MDILLTCHIEDLGALTYFVVFELFTLDLRANPTHLDFTLVVGGVMTCFFGLEGHFHASWRCIDLRYVYGHTLETYFRVS
jgi:hypothetical protein